MKEVKRRSIQEIAVRDVVELIESVSDNKTLNVFIHSCNCFNNMGAGIAKALSDAYPVVASCENIYEPGDKKKLGRYTFAYIKPSVVVANAYSQYNYGWLNALDSSGRQTDYDALQKALTSIRDDFASRSPHPIVFYAPLMIGAGNAKGDPEIIQPMVKEIFEDHDLILFYI